jgi:hypothetical protein
MLTAGVTEESVESRFADPGEAEKVNIHPLTILSVIKDLVRFGLGASLLDLLYNMADSAVYNEVGLPGSTLWVLDGSASMNNSYTCQPDESIWSVAKQLTAIRLARSNGEATILNPDPRFLTSFDDTGTVKGACSALEAARYANVAINNIKLSLELCMGVADRLVLISNSSLTLADLPDLGKWVHVFVPGGQRPLVSSSEKKSIFTCAPRHLNHVIKLIENLDATASRIIEQ